MSLKEKKPVSRRVAYTLSLALMIAIPAGLMGYKQLVLGYAMNDLVPAVSYGIDLGLQVTGHGEDVSITTYLPASNARQLISEEQNAAGLFSFALSESDGSRLAFWNARGVQGQQNLLYSFVFQGQHVRYEIPDGMRIPNVYPPELQPYLEATEGIQVDDPLIGETLQQILPAGDPELRMVLWTIHRYLQDQLENRNFSGYTDALTALKLQAASCNGKSRLFAALARKLGLPARLVGGLIVQPGTKRVSHQWLEVFLNGHWVPFDTINDHFAEIPAHYLTLYYGDEVLFRHTSNVNFKYGYKILRRTEPRREALSRLGGSPLNIINFYTLFERIGISANLLRIILLIPVGALVTVIARNVIGLQTFGTFLPALIAAAARQTGLLWGLIGFAVIILVMSGLFRYLDWLQLLHTPKMAVMLTSVVIFMLIITSLGVRFGLFDLAHVTLFPIAILAITAERYARIQEEDGVTKALTVMLVTLGVVAACFAVMDSLFFQSLILAFPELLLVVIALDLWLGKWMGMRLTEFFRFRRLLRADVSAGGSA
jgi:hypothetical protein